MENVFLKALEKQYLFFLNGINCVIFKGSCNYSLTTMM